MRNFKYMPDNITIDEHLDVDLLVSNYYLAKTILDGTSATNNRYEDGKLVVYEISEEIFYYDRGGTWQISELKTSSLRVQHFANI